MYLLLLLLLLLLWLLHEILLYKFVCTIFFGFISYTYVWMYIGCMCVRVNMCDESIH